MNTINSVSEVLYNLIFIILSLQLLLVLTPLFYDKKWKLIKRIYKINTLIFYYLLGLYMLSLCIIICDFIFKNEIIPKSLIKHMISCLGLILIDIVIYAFKKVKRINQCSQ